MFLKDRKQAAKSIRAGIAIFASCAVTIGVTCVLPVKKMNAAQQPRNKMKNEIAIVEIFRANPLAAPLYWHNS